MDPTEIKKRRAKGLFDKSGWLLILPFALVLFLVDPSMAKTLLEWLTFAPILAGTAVIVSRVVFPQIHLSTLVHQTLQGNRAASFLACALIGFVAVIFAAMVFWSKA